MTTWDPGDISADIDERREIIEALHHACWAAKRLPQVLGTTEHPSRWDRAHAHLDSLLGQLELVDIVG